MKRPITSALLADLFTGHKTSFRSGTAGATSVYEKVATKVPSSARSETYSWLGKWPRIREWIGDRELKKLSGNAYTITNRKFESTVSVNRDDIEDDQLGIYGPMFQELGRATAVFPDELVFALLAAGETTKCYDGQPFFDDEHPVGDGVVANLQAGAGPGWYLLDVSRALKPLIYQERRPFGFVALDDLKDTNVVMKDEFIYGTDGRCNVGFGFWQMAFKSKGDLTEPNFAAARAAMASFKDDEGGPLGVIGNLLVVPPSLEGKARTLMTAQQIDGTDNPWKGTAEVLVVPWLA